MSWLSIILSIIICLYYIVVYIMVYIMRNHALAYQIIGERGRRRRAEEVASLFLVMKEGGKL